MFLFDVKYRSTRLAVQSARKVYLHRWHSKNRIRLLRRGECFRKKNGRIRNLTRTNTWSPGKVALGTSPQAFRTPSSATHPYSRSNVRLRFLAPLLATCPPAHKGRKVPLSFSHSIGSPATCRWRKRSRQWWSAVDHCRAREKFIAVFCYNSKNFTVLWS